MAPFQKILNSRHEDSSSDSNEHTEPMVEEAVSPQFGRSWVSSAQLFDHRFDIESLSAEARFHNSSSKSESEFHTDNDVCLLMKPKSHNSNANSKSNLEFHDVNDVCPSLDCHEDENICLATQLQCLSASSKPNPESHEEEDVCHPREITSCENSFAPETASQSDEVHVLLTSGAHVPAQLSQKLARLQSDQNRLQHIRRAVIDDLTRLDRLLETASYDNNHVVVNELQQRKKSAEEVLNEIDSESQKIAQAESGMIATENSHVEALQKANQHAHDIRLAVEKTSAEHQSLTLDLEAIEYQRSQVEMSVAHAKQIQAEVSKHAQAWERTKSVLKNVDQELNRLGKMQSQRPNDKAILRQIKEFNGIREKLQSEQQKLQEYCLYAEGGDRIERSIEQLEAESQRLAKLSEETCGEKEKLEKKLQDMWLENQKVMRRLEQSEQAQHDLDRYWSGLLESSTLDQHGDAHSADVEL
eukprot:gnl/MRDRNA2_/MRDRNA2_104875_c0_seq1.p1 gnl/MRDRNA2_/MRDRNA2_104875_c0~~gnl/MRDRNA2_/MRDRNA2_104875_c0_seq1.p1  ORF type:complete len:493 (-),score=117.11 gnl/MRDRNA2_/MRDRNA2_104875_c0_seq1:89-1504(-)